VAITKLKHHDRCPVEVIILNNKPHYAQLRCARHDKHIQWLSKEDTKKLLENN
jgi:hypothetical protein